MGGMKNLLESWGHERECNIRQVPRLMAKGKQGKKLQKILTNFEFIDAKIDLLNPQAMLEDYELAVNSNCRITEENKAALRLIQKALQQSAHILEKDPTQLPSQLLAKLDSSNHPLLNKLLTGNKDDPGARLCSEYAWLEPLTARPSTLEQPFEVVIPTGHPNSVQALAISGDGRFALSAGSDDTTIKFWDLSSRRELLSFRVKDVREFSMGEELDNEVSPQISAMALSHTGRWAAIGLLAYGLHGSDQALIEVWDLDAGTRLQRFASLIRVEWESIAISRSGHHVVTGYSSIDFTGCFMVWLLSPDLTSVINRAELQDAVFTQMLAASDLATTSVAISPDGFLAVTASGESVLVWDLILGKLVDAIKIGADLSLSALNINSECVITAIFNNQMRMVWRSKTPSISRLENWESVDTNYDLFERGLKKLDKQFRYHRSVYNRYCSVGIYRVILAIPRIRQFALWWAEAKYRRNIVSVVALLLKVIGRIIRRRKQDAEDNEILNYNLPESSPRKNSSTLKLLWRSLRLYKNAPLPETTLLDLSGLPTPKHITVDGQKGLIHSSTNDLILIDVAAVGNKVVTSASPLTTKTQSERTYLEAPPLMYQTRGLSVDGRFLLTLDNRGCTYKCDFMTEEPLIPLQYEKMSREAIPHSIEEVAISLNKRWAFLIRHNSFDAWDLAEKATDSSPPQWYLREVSSNGCWALWQSDTRTLRLTNLKTGELKGEIRDYYGDLADTERWNARSHESESQAGWAAAYWEYSEELIEYAAKISADGSKVLIYSAHSNGAWLWQPTFFALWDVATGRVLQTLSAEILYEGQKFWDFDRQVSAFALCSNGSYALVGFETGEIKFCDLTAQEAFLFLDGHQQRVTDIALSANECWAVSCSLDKTVKVWHIPSKEQVACFTSDYAFYKCQIRDDDKDFIIITSDAIKDGFLLRLNILQSPPPEAESEVPVVELAPLNVEEQANDSVMPQSLLLERQIGIPLPLNQLHELPVVLDSDVWLDYQPLKAMLEAESWEEANRETESLITRVLKAQAEIQGNTSENITVTPELLKEFPATDLLTIDRLWLKYSNGRYGFSLQMNIWGVFWANYTDFLILIGHRHAADLRLFIDRRLHRGFAPCESLDQRRGYFPFFFVHERHHLAGALFTRLASCVDYPWIPNFER